MASSKWPQHDENRPFWFVDQSTPVPKRHLVRALRVSRLNSLGLYIRTVVCKGLLAGIDSVFASAESVGWACLDMGLERRLSVYFGL